MGIAYPMEESVLVNEVSLFYKVFQKIYNGNSEGCAYLKNLMSCNKGITVDILFSLNASKEQYRVYLVEADNLYSKYLMNIDCSIFVKYNSVFNNKGMFVIRFGNLLLANTKDESSVSFYEFVTYVLKKDLLNFYPFIHRLAVDEITYSVSLDMSGTYSKSYDKFIQKAFFDWSKVVNTVNSKKFKNFDLPKYDIDIVQVMVSEVSNLQSSFNDNSLIIRVFSNNGEIKLGFSSAKGMYSYGDNDLIDSFLESIVHYCDKLSVLVNSLTFIIGKGNSLSNYLGWYKKLNNGEVDLVLCV